MTFQTHKILLVLLKYSLSLLLCIGASNNSRAQKFTQFVDPLIGSGGHGHVFVGASVPFGAVQLGPNNIYKGWDWCSGYHYSDSLIIGFSHLHLSGTGIGDLADILIMPVTGEVKLDKGRQAFPHNGYLSTFSHNNEISKPGYYSVKMDNGVAVELTASERVGFHQYRFPKGKEAHAIIDLKEGINDKSTDTYLEQTDEFTLKGYRFTVDVKNNSPENIYIQSIELNGKVYNKIYISHQDILHGGAMRIIMGKQPNYNFGTLVQNRP